MIKIFSVALIAVISYQLKAIDNCQTYVTADPTRCEKCVTGYFPADDQLSCMPCKENSCKECINDGTGGNHEKCTICQDPNMDVIPTSQSRCQCKTGFYITKSEKSCKVCAKPCKSCTANTDDSQKCLSCYQPEMMNDGTNCACVSKYYLNDDLTQCLTCKAPCNTCKNKGTGGDTQECQSCIDDTSMNLLDNCKCKDGFYDNLLKTACVKCPNTCTTCHNDLSDSPVCDKCKNVEMEPAILCACKPGFYVSDSEEICILCDSTCSTCVNKKNGKNDMRCTTCPHGEMIIDITTGKCECPLKTFKTKDLKVCIDCLAPCETCHGDDDDKQVCDSCSDPEYMVLENKCSCKLNMYPTKDNKECLGCPIRCPGCTGNSENLPVCEDCIDPNMVRRADKLDCECKSDYFITMDMKSCKACPGSPCRACLGDSGDQPVCKSCIDPERMRIQDDEKNCECRDGYFMNNANNACLTCEAPCANCLNFGDDTQSCKTCKDTAHMDGQHQCSCVGNTFMKKDKTLCLLCPDSCKGCVNNDNDKPLCNSCVDDNMEVKNNLCQCKDGFYMNQEGNTCAKCDESCATCALEKISETEYLPVCVKCPEIRMVVNAQGKCVCPENYFKTNDLLDCKLCLSPCSSCKAGVNDEQVCTECKDTDMILENNCECKPTMYMKNDKSDCLACPIRCSTCVGTDTNKPICINCEDPFMSVGPLKDDCVCNDGYYLMNDELICMKCPGRSCKYCANRGNDEAFCTKCEDKQMHVEDDGKCYCASHTYMSKNERDCLQCPIKCIECTGNPADEAICNACRDPYDMDLSNNCECKPGYVSTQHGDDCVLCPYSCSTCAGREDKIICTKCKSASMILENQCGCPAGTTMSQDFSSCLTCSKDGSCAQCTDASGELQCLRCFENSMSIINNICVCPAKHYFDKGCKQCDGRCNTCTGPASNQCLSCASIKHLVMKNGQCVCEGSYLYENGECKYNKSGIVIYVVIGFCALLALSLIFVVIAAICG